MGLASWILYSLEDQERNREGVGGVNYVFYKEETLFLLPSFLPESCRAANLFDSEHY